MKTIKLIIVGAVLVSGTGFAQIKETDINNNTKPYELIKRGAFIKEVSLFAAPHITDTRKHRKVGDIFHSGEFGLRFMPTFSSIDLKNSNGGTVKGDFVVGYGYGAFIAINSKHVGLQLEGIYSSTSQKYKDGAFERKVDMNYVNVPLLLTLNTNKTQAVNVNIAIGPQLGLNVGSKVTTTGGDNNAENTNAVLVVKKGDFGFAYGTGIEFALNPARTFRFNLGFRGVFGLVDISDKSKSKTTNQYYILDRTNVETYAGYAGLSILF